MSERTEHPAAMTESALLNQCELRRDRRGGPGGQRRNKVETAIVLIHTPTGLRAEAAERRHAEENRRIALARLRLELARKVRRPHNKGPSPLWQSRCTGGRIAVSTSHQDFPAILAEALDVVEILGFDLRDAAESLHCTASQLRKLLQQDPLAWSQIQNSRESVGLPRLR